MTHQSPSPSFLSCHQDGLLHLSAESLLDLLKAVIEKGAPFRFRATGTSMSPFIKDGDVVTVSPCPGRDVQLGDVVAIGPPPNGRLIVHRVVGRKGDHLFIQGDNRAEGDGLIPRVNIYGRVTRIERKGKAVTLGLGIERFLIAFLVRRGWLLPLMIPLWRTLRPFLRRS